MPVCFGRTSSSATCGHSIHELTGRTPWRPCMCLSQCTAACMCLSQCTFLLRQRGSGGDSATVLPVGVRCLAEADTAGDTATRLSAGSGASRKVAQQRTGCAAATRIGLSWLAARTLFGKRCVGSAARFDLGSGTELRILRYATLIEDRTNAARPRERGRASLLQTRATQAPVNRWRFVRRSHARVSTADKSRATRSDSPQDRSGRSARRTPHRRSGRCARSERPHQ